MYEIGIERPAPRRTVLYFRQEHISSRTGRHLRAASRIYFVLDLAYDIARITIHRDRPSFRDLNCVRQRIVQNGNQLNGIWRFTCPSRDVIRKTRKHLSVLFRCEPVITAEPRQQVVGSGVVEQHPECIEVSARLGELQQAVKGFRRAQPSEGTTASWPLYCRT